MTERKRTITTQKKVVPFGALFAGFQGDIVGFEKANGLKALESLSGILQAQILQLRGGPGTRLGTVPAYGFSAKEILYHKLQITDTYQYSYLSGSGIYRNATGGTNPVTSANFQEFINALLDGDPSGASSVSYAQNLYNFATGAPNILVKKQCYVVIELHGSSGMRFQADAPAIETVYDCTNYYYDLYHIDTSGNATANTSSDTPCLLFYFSVEDPDLARGDDQFNLYLQIDQPTSTVLVTIDPFIKNRGGPALEGKR